MSLDPQRSSKVSRRKLMVRAGTGMAAITVGAALSPAFSPAKAAFGSMLSPDDINLNVQMEEIVDAYMALHPLPIQILTAPNARNLPTPRDAVEAVLTMHHQSNLVEPVGSVKHILIPGPGGQLIARVYTPFGSGPFPVLVYFHGGGWVIANLDAYDSSCRALTNAAKFIVVSVAYRQAPEHPFPAAADDAYASTQWVMANAASLNGIPSKVAVGGESAGGNLAAVTALRARDLGTRMPIYQLLVYPITNHNFDTPSYMEYANAPFLTRAAMMYFWQNYLPNPAAGNNPYASPLRAASLAHLPPATVIVDENDPLRSEGTAYAERLRAAGVPTVFTVYLGVTHEFFSMSAVLDQARRAVAEAAAGLRSA
ncbi:MAG: alpha/beta hydrolase, partial [Chloroflexota bacterium]|nr:alpha/beta hydrolase [Chloroflexota bacterium]